LWQLEGAWVAACGVESLAVKRASDACKSQPPAVSEIVPQPQLVDRTLEHIRHLAMLTTVLRSGEAGRTILALVFRIRVAGHIRHVDLDGRKPEP